MLYRISGSASRSSGIRRRRVEWGLSNTEVRFDTLAKAASCFPAREAESSPLPPRFGPEVISIEKGWSPLAPDINRHLPADTGAAYAQGFLPHRIDFPLRRLTLPVRS